ncbi:GNAT family N-acetyltransferase [Enterococcus sp. LJL99]
MLNQNKKISFIPYCTEDQSLYNELVFDINVMRYITERAETPSEAKDNFEKIIHYNQINHDVTGYYKIMAGETYIGFGKLSWTDKKEIEIGYMILPNYWGNGYASKFVRDQLHKIQTSPQLEKVPVLAIIDPNNLASKKILLKNGFTSVWKGIEEGLPSEHLYWRAK